MLRAMPSLSYSSPYRLLQVATLLASASCIEVVAPDFDVPQSPVTGADAGNASPPNGGSQGGGDTSARDAGGVSGDDDLATTSDAGEGLVDAGSSDDEDHDADVGAPDPDPGAPVRFIVFGDGGTGEAGQKKVAAVVADVCAQRGCQFALYLGDNIYDDGVTSATDMQFVTKFEEPYAALDFPFYVALGNHDYGSGGSNIFPEDSRSAAQVEYTAHSDKWYMPHYYYSVRRGPVEFFVLDTNAIVLDRFRRPAEQKAWLHDAMAKSDAPWKIVMGHHPYISNGKHGNAGNYNDIPLIRLGQALKEIIDEEVCGKAQIYFAGHDHHREWLEPTCGTAFIVSGAAAKLREATARRAASRWVDDKKLGFLWAEIAGDTFTGVFYDEDGHINYEDTVSR